MNVEWDEKVCQHAGVCVKTLPKVFKIEGGSFVIDSSAASEEEVRNVLEKCPSGALTAKD